MQLLQQPAGFFCGFGPDAHLYFCSARTRLSHSGFPQFHGHVQSTIGPLPLRNPTVPPSASLTLISILLKSVKAFSAKMVNKVVVRDTGNIQLL
jgi:hypothetical protein